MENLLYGLQASFTGRSRDRPAEGLFGTDIAGESAVQPGGDQVAAALPFDQHHEGEEEGSSKVNDFGMQHNLVRPGTISTQYFF